MLCLAACWPHPDTLLFLTIITDHPDSRHLPSTVLTTVLSSVPSTVHHHQHSPLDKVNWTPAITFPKHQGHSWRQGPSLATVAISVRLSCGFTRLGQPRMLHGLCLLATLISLVPLPLSHSLLLWIFKESVHVPKILSISVPSSLPTPKCQTSAKCPSP